MKKMFVSATAALCFIVLTGVPGQSASQPAPAQEQVETSLSGKVVETMTSGGYTYVQIEKKGQKTWVAVPETKVTVGQDVSFEPGVEMGAFASNTLKRKFDNIFFSAGIVGQSTMAHGTAMSGAGGTDAASADAITVKKAEGPDAYTINELVSNSAGLDRKKVVVSGKVVKVSESIMGKNWIHIMDGSGDRREKLVVTSKDLPKVGDIITVSGTFYKDKDFGSGYKYAMIVEEATIKK